MKNRFLSILLATIMLASIFALTSCDTIFESLFGSNGTHEHEWSEWETIKSADCKNSGTAERFCDCGETQTKSLPVSEHNSSGWIVDNEATCQVEGSKHKECTVCHTVLANEKIGKTEHNYGEWIDEIHATTESEGTLGHYHCSACDKNFDADKKELNSIVIPKLDNEDPTVHNHTSSGWIVDKEATCSADGSRHKECTECKEEIVREIIPATGNHSYGEWYIVKEATEYEDGLRERKCECGKVESEVIEAPEKEYSIYYMNLKSAEYPSETGYNSKDGLLYLPTVESEGYVFIGWYTASVGGDIVDYIPKGSKQDYVLFAHWEFITYDIIYKNVPNNTNPTSYNIETKISLETPKWSGLEFTHWSDEDGNVYLPNVNITFLPEKMTGNLVLTANWKVLRNIATPAGSDAHLYNVFASEDGMLYFFYDLGTIEHVVLDNIDPNLYYKAEGMPISLTLSKTVSISEETAKSISDTISKSISQTSAWQKSYSESESHSKNWNAEIGVGINAGIGGGTQSGASGEAEKEGKKLSASLAKMFNLSVNVHIEGSYNWGGEDTYTREWGQTESYSSTNSETQSHTVNSSLAYKEQISSEIVENFTIGADLPSGYYAYVHAANIRVIGIVTYEIATGYMYLNTYSRLDNMHSMVMYYPTVNELNNPSIEGLNFSIPEEEIINMIEKSYYVKYDANGGTGTMPTTIHSINGAEQLAKNEFTKEGYLFAGWELTTEDGTKTFIDGQSVTNIGEPLHTVTLKAVWVEDPSYDKDVVYTLTTITGSYKSEPQMRYSALIEYRNRTEDSIEIRITWTTIKEHGYNSYGQNFSFSCGSASSGRVRICGYNGLADGYTSKTKESGWVKISLNTSDATTIDLNIKYWQTNNDDGTINEKINTIWTLNIPAN